MTKYDQHKRELVPIKIHVTLDETIILYNTVNYEMIHISFFKMLKVKLCNTIALHEGIGILIKYTVVVFVIERESLFKYIFTNINVNVITDNMINLYITTAYERHLW